MSDQRPRLPVLVLLLTALALCSVVLRAPAQPAAPVAPAAPSAFDAATWLPDSVHRPPRSREPLRSIMRRRDFVAATDTARVLYRVLMARDGVDSASVACVMMDFASLALGTRPRDPELPGFFTRALAIARQHPGRDSLFLLRAWDFEAEWHRNKGEWARAESLYHRNLAAMERLLPVDHIDLASSLFGIAACRQQLGLQSGLPYIERAITVQELRRGPRDLGTAMARYQYAAQLLTDGQTSRARIEGERAIAVIRAGLGPQHPDLPRYLRSLGILARADGDLPAARRHMEEGVALVRARTPMDTLALSRLLGPLAGLRNDLGDFDGALASAREAVAGQRGRIAAGNPQAVSAYYEAGRALAALGEPLTAQAMLDTALAGAGSDSTVIDLVVAARAERIRSGGDLAAARRWAAAVAALPTGTLSGGQVHEVAGSAVVAETFTDAGAPGEAAALLREALPRAQRVHGPSHPSIARLREAEARALVAAGDPAAPAAALALAALRRESMQALALGFAEAEAMAVAERDGRGLDALLALAGAGRLDAEARREALAAVASVRGLVLETLARRLREARGAASPAARAALDTLAAARADHARALVRGYGSRAAEDSALMAMGARVRRAEVALADLVPSLVAPPPVSAASLEAALGPEEALVSYALHRSPGAGEPQRNQVLALVLRRDGEVRAVALGDAGTLTQAVAAWRSAASPGGTRAAARRTGEVLRRRIWDPLAPALTGAARVWVVPEGPLHLVDLAALPAAGGGWLVEQAPAIARLSSERDLLAAPQSERGERALVVAAPDFDLATSTGEPLAAAFRGGRSACRGFAEVRFEPLPGARLEGEAAVSGYTARGRAARLLAGPEASEAAFKAAAPGASALHLATHGFFLGEACGADALGARGVGRLVVARPAAAARPAARPRSRLHLPEAPAVAREHPLRLAGLALAGANRRAEAPAEGEDGVLTSEEVAALDLSGVREVVLSACDTGVGEVAVGEGVFGLQRAFRTAGAGTLVMSLWPVRDADAVPWMAAYHAARAAGEAPGDAVRAAARARLAAVRATGGDEHPARWAGFIASGR